VRSDSTLTVCAGWQWRRSLYSIYRHHVGGMLFCRRATYVAHARKCVISRNRPTWSENVQLSTLWRPLFVRITFIPQTWRHRFAFCSVHRAYTRMSHRRLDTRARQTPAIWVSSGRWKMLGLIN